MATRLSLKLLFALGAAAMPVAHASARWTAANPDAAAAAREPRIAAVLDAVDRMDRSLIDDDHVAFAAALADDLVVNNPQNSFSARGVTARLNVDGRIGYTRYERTIDYAGLRGEMVVLMGEETVVPKPPNPAAGTEVHRRFTDIWESSGGRWRLTARQATIIQRAP